MIDIAKLLGKWEIEQVGKEVMNTVNKLVIELHPDKRFTVNGLHAGMWSYDDEKNLLTTLNNELVKIITSVELLEDASKLKLTTVQKLSQAEIVDMTKRPEEPEVFIYKRLN